DGDRGAPSKDRGQRRETRRRSPPARRRQQRAVWTSCVSTGTTKTRRREGRTKTFLYKGFFVGLRAFVSSWSRRGFYKRDVFSPEVREGTAVPAPRRPSAGSGCRRRRLSRGGCTRARAAATGAARSRPCLFDRPAPCARARCRGLPLPAR